MLESGEVRGKGVCLCIQQDRSGEAELSSMGLDQQNCLDSHQSPDVLGELAPQAGALKGNLCITGS